MRKLRKIQWIVVISGGILSILLFLCFSYLVLLILNELSTFSSNVNDGSISFIEWIKNLLGGIL